MIVQPTAQQTRRVTRSRTYSGPGFGPRSFECLGMSMALNIASSAGASGPTTPLSILGATATRLWLRADLGVSGLGTAGATWVDQSGNWGANFVQATVANQAVQALDGTIGQQAFTFDGGNDAWGSAGVFPSQSVTPYAIIVVAKIPSLAVSGQPLIGADSYAPAIATFSASRLGLQAGAAGPAFTGAAGWKRIVAELTNSTSDRLVQGSVSASAVSAGANTAANSYIGGIPTASAWLACSVAEVIVVRPIPVSYTAIDAYLAGRYGASIHT